MDADFWHQRWAAKKIGFHESAPNPLLVANFEELSLKRDARVFVPLCGKTLDIGWLMSRGYRVVGVELSDLAIGQLFEELGIEPNITAAGGLNRYSGPGIDIFVGDLFGLTGDLLRPVDAIFDRAALVALPQEMRGRYAEHLAEITGNAPQLLVTYEYDQRLMDGPPFSVTGEEVHRIYSGHYEISLLDGSGIADDPKRPFVANEKCWLLCRPAGQPDGRR
ncbi:MAG: thiopurine S-methyltransferase [Alphaproteobacteria bacterium]